MVDLSEFSAWRADVCRYCGEEALVTGPPGGPIRCHPCWRGEARLPKPVEEPAPENLGLFDAEEYTATPLRRRLDRGL